MRNFYRTPVAYVVAYGAYVNGRWEETSSYEWIKCNIQPWKEGLVTNIQDIGKFYTGYKRFYFKEKPTVSIPDGAQEEGVYIFYQGEFYSITGNQDWTTLARGPKHFKFLGIVADPQPDIDAPVEE